MPDPDQYIIEPLDTDAQAIYQNFVEYVQAAIPGWNPSEPQLDVIMARFFAQQQAVIADMASRVQRSIYRYLGANLENIPPLPGSPATATISLHVMDSGQVPPQLHRLPISTVVGLTDINGDLQMFTTLAEVDVDGTVEYASVTAQAVQIGTQGNNITGAVELLEQTDWIDQALVVGASSGGTDPEDDVTYLSRLTANLAIPRRPSIVQDFVTMTRNVAGVWRAAAIDNFRDTGGGTFATDQENSVAITAVDLNGEEVSTAIRDQILAYITSNLRQNWLVTWVSPTYHLVDVTFDAQAYPYPGTDGDSVASDAISRFQYALSPANYGAMLAQDSREWITNRTVRYLDMTTVLENTNLVDYTKNLVFGIAGGAQDKTDKALTGIFPLTRPGTITGTVEV